jgi:hypothetical protein
MSPDIRFVLISWARSGTTLAIDLIRQHPEVYAHCEVFIRDGVETWQFDAQFLDQVDGQRGARAGPTDQHKTDVRAHTAPLDWPNRGARGTRGTAVYRQSGHAGNAQKRPVTSPKCRMLRSA